MKTISNFLVILEELFWENIISKYDFVFVQTYASYLQRNISQNDLFSKMFALQKMCLKQFSNSIL
jgi:hypothetical protein